MQEIDSLGHTRNTDGLFSLYFVNRRVNVMRTESVVCEAIT